MGIVITYSILWGMLFVLFLLTMIGAGKLNHYKKKKESTNKYGEHRNKEKFQRYKKSEEFWSKIITVNIFVFIFLLISLLIATPVTFTTQYNQSINLPQKYITTSKAIEETKSMLIKNNQDITKENIERMINLGNLGQGLEGKKAKNIIYKLVAKKAKIERKIRFKNRHVFTFFKPRPVPEVK